MLFLLESTRLNLAIVLLDWNQSSVVYNECYDAPYQSTDKDFAFVIRTCVRLERIDSYSWLCTFDRSCAPMVGAIFSFTCILGRWFWFFHPMWVFVSTPFHPFGYLSFCLPSGLPFRTQGIEPNPFGLCRDPMPLSHPLVCAWVEIRHVIPCRQV